jgi:hypothetical protein
MDGGSEEGLRPFDTREKPLAASVVVVVFR